MHMLGWALISMVASYAISSLLMKPVNVKPTSSDEIDFPQEEEGIPQGVLFGDGWTKGYQTVWHGNIRTKKIKAGGKK